MSSPPDRSRWLPALAALILAVAGIGTLIETAADVRREDMLFGVWRLRHVIVAAGLIVLAGALTCRAIGRGAWLGLLTAVIPVGLLLVALEMAGRAGLVDWAALLSPGAAQGEPVGWTLRPGVSVQGHTGQDIAARLGLAHDPIPFDFRADAYGFRNGDEAEGQIVLLGDSIVLGAAVPAEHTVAEVAETALEQPVMQAALLGLSIQGAQDMLRTSGLPLAGKTVVQVLFEGNDLLDSHAWRNQGEASAPVPAGTSSLGRLAWDRLVRLSNPAAPYYTCEIGDRTVGFLWTRRAFAGVQGEVDEITRAITAFRTELAQQGAEYALVFVPTKYRVLAPQCAFPAGSPIADPSANLSDLPDRIGTFARRQGIRYLDLTSPLTAAADQGRLPWFWGDTHWNSTGHAAAGQAIAAWLSGWDG